MDNFGSRKNNPPNTWMPFQCNIHIIFVRHGELPSLADLMSYCLTVAREQITPSDIELGNRLPVSEEII